MVQHCSYCRRTNDHVGVCDGCGAPLPYEEVNYRDSCWTMSENYQTRGSAFTEVNRFQTNNPYGFRDAIISGRKKSG
jgi:predicted amidophosphoribosyltransferase